MYALIPQNPDRILPVKDDNHYGDLPPDWEGLKQVAPRTEPLITCAGGPNFRELPPGGLCPALSPRSTNNRLRIPQAIPFRVNRS